MKKPIMADPILHISKLTVTAGPRTLLRDVSLSIDARRVFGIIGASGSGKSTLLKSLNRLLDLTKGVSVQGQVSFQGKPIYAPGIDTDALRARIGILFQQPVVFPKSIYQNVIFGVRHLGSVPRAQWPATAESALREASLWDEVKDRLHQSALRLSVGQQQRLCLARTLAVNPDVILMDEPTSALDPKSTEAIEELVTHLKAKHTIVLVTHNLKQARHLADTLAFIGVREDCGQLLALGTSGEVLKRDDVPELVSFLGSGDFLQTAS
jgi:phosphate transport system ATP-binding protein